MTTPFTDVDAAVEEGHFIQNTLNKTAYLVCDVHRDIYVLTEDQYAHKKWADHTVLEIFHPGGCNGDERVPR
jgi:hypothetical protein